MNELLVLVGLGLLRVVLLRFWRDVRTREEGSRVGKWEGVKKRLLRTAGATVRFRRALIIVLAMNAFFYPARFVFHFSGTPAEAVPVVPLRVQAARRSACSFQLPAIPTNRTGTLDYSFNCTVETNNFTQSVNYFPNLLFAKVKICLYV